MPNHCYCAIIVHNDKDRTLLEEIVKKDGGLAEYLLPMPKELQNTTSPTQVVSPQAFKEHEKKKDTEKFWSRRITKEMQEEYIDKYKFDNWYDWSLHNWGTKWGCYNNNMAESVYHFTTAWSPLCSELIEEFSKLVTSFVYTYEEEQGWGGWMSYKDGVCYEWGQYDIPNWTTHKHFIINKEGFIKEIPEDHSYQDPMYEDWDYLCSVTYLDEDEYTNIDDTYTRGWYEEYSLTEFVGETEKEVLEFYTHFSQEHQNSL